MENQIRPIAMILSEQQAHRKTGWIVAPWFDLLFIANLGWLLLLIPGFSYRPDTAIDFWQIYFLTLPHRWITLLLVVLDSDRRTDRTRRLILIAAGALIFVFSIWLGTGALTCLAVIDFIWNAWHFGSQHAGVLRIYSRKVGSGWEFLERHGIRWFVTYTALRTVGWATGWIESYSISWYWLDLVDGLMLLIPLTVWLSNSVGFRQQHLGKWVYVSSICWLYSGLILSLSFRHVGLITALAVASSLFHAVEYLAIVTHYAWNRQRTGSDGLFRQVANQWLLFLGLYMLVLGCLGVLFDRQDSGMRETWQALNVWAALVHYSFDGMIWKLRRPETAKALGIS